jgi:hypothetical protein
LIRGFGGVVLATAVYEILGEGIDWVLDPDNNAVKYSETPDDDAAPTGSYWITNNNTGTISYSPSRSCELARTIYGEPKDDNYTLVSSPPYYLCSAGSYPKLYVQIKTDGDADDRPNQEYLPISTVADKVIDNADAGGADEIQLMADIAYDSFAAGELDSALDSSAEPKVFDEGESDPLAGSTTDPDEEDDDDTEVSTPTDGDEETEEEPFVLPEFCDWASSVCDFIDWVQAEPDTEDNEVDIEEEEVEPTDTNISFGGSCPADFAYHGSIFGNSIDITLLNTAQLCDFLSFYVKYPLIAVSSLSALYIYGGRNNG